MLLSRLLDILYSAIPPKYYVYILLAVLTLAVIHAYAQGRRTDRERDLHARVILVTVRMPYLIWYLTTELCTGWIHTNGSYALK